MSSGKENVNKDARQQYLESSDVSRFGELHDQTWAKRNMYRFHESIELTIQKCKVCCEGWPMKTKPRSPEQYVCGIKSFPKSSQRAIESYPAVNHLSSKSLLRSIKGS